MLSPIDVKKYWCTYCNTDFCPSDVIECPHCACKEKNDLAILDADYDSTLEEFVRFSDFGEGD